MNFPNPHFDESFVEIFGSEADSELDEQYATITDEGCICNYCGADVESNNPDDIEHFTFCETIEYHGTG